MSNEKQPWQAKWKREKDLGRGGQGTAVLVSSLNDPTKGVLKTLNKNTEQARRRMRREVVNLDVLSKDGLKVPRVLDGNTEQFDERGVPLYFVMEFVEGRTLDKEVRDRGPLLLDKAAEITLDLAVTVAAAHKEDVLHRDLKPDNVMVRRFDPADLVIVDYGLSFNQDEEGSAETLTNSDEQFRNRFLALPEANTPGGDRRDKRSDVTALSGILYFCLTGHNPGHLVDGSGKAPHRRQGFTVRQRLGSDTRCNAVEALLDRGFAVELENRFQSCDEFVERLRAALVPPTQEEEPSALAARLGVELRANNRKTRLAGYLRMAAEIREIMTRAANQSGSNLAPFSLSPGVRQFQKEEWPPNVDQLFDGLTLTVNVEHHQQTRAVFLPVGLRGEQFVLLRAFGVHQRQGLHQRRQGRLAPLQWEELMCST